MAQMLTFDDLDPITADPLAGWSPHPACAPLAAADDELDNVDEEDDDEEDDDEDEDDEEADEDEEDEDDEDDDEEDDEDESEDEDVADEDARNARGQLRRQNGHVAPQVRPR
jgi:hypothetical protein